MSRPARASGLALRETAAGAACVNATSSSSVSPCVQRGVTRRPSTRWTTTSWLCTSAWWEREAERLAPVAVAPDAAPATTCDEPSVLELALALAVNAMS